jgi:two-component system, sensor histidine kinase and response regulator
MPDPASEPGVPSVIEAGTLPGGDEASFKQQQDRGPESPVAGVVPWNPDQTLERLGGDEKLLREVVEIFLEEVPKHLAGLRMAITQQDAETVERMAHSLQGELGYLSIAELSHGARELEERGRSADFKGAFRLLPPFEAAVARLLGSMGQTQKLGLHEQLPPGSSGINR